MSTDIYIDYGNCVMHSALTHEMLITEYSNNIPLKKRCTIYHLYINDDGSGYSIAYIEGQAYIEGPGAAIKKHLTKDEVDTMLKILGVMVKQ